ncbi:porin [Pseudothauera nasutitermitis]|uniref:Porin n=1 Tax=Pseudothauera nasutitermitis TaxID=2565930 RepID=A0A4V3WBG4_9RHOO|nr:porin [Pseudothauera nasutitermitis]THF63139.1 porin [Pseudothauera nasutitermitis]
MQKKLIALAVATLVAAPAFAQSNVTVYGVVDMGLDHRSGSKTHKNRSGLDSGLQSGSRIGFRGVEDLGNGLKASFVLEQGINVDRNSTAGLLGSNANRQSFLALSGGFGTVALGRQETPQHKFVDAVDPFGGGTVGQANGVYAKTASRLDNVIAYVTPDFSGFSLTAAYTANGTADEAAIPKNTPDTNLKVFALHPVYKNGPLLVGLNYIRTKAETATQDNKSSTWEVGAAYDFGVLRLSVLYGEIDYDNHATYGDNDRKQWMLGASIPVGAAGKVAVSYVNAEYDKKIAGNNIEGKQVAVGYFHDLSKRTNLYAAYAKRSDEMRFTNSGSGVVENNTGYKNGLNVGIRHRF